MLLSLMCICCVSVCLSDLDHCFRFGWNENPFQLFPMFLFRIIQIKLEIRDEKKSDPKRNTETGKWKSEKC